jgi:hypothetical protein
MRISGTRIGRFEADARVLFTHNHACGDPGSSVLPLQLLMLPECSLRWLETHPDASAHAFGQRINWRGQARLRLAPYRVLNFTTMVGVDNSRLLPPAVRSQRSEDLLFGIAAQAMYPASWVVDLPFGLPHLRAPAKRWLASTDPFPQEPLHFAYACLEDHAPRIAAESAAQRLAAIGALLLDIAAASDRDLAAMLSRHAAEAASHVLFAVQTQLDSATLPAQWKAVLAPWLRSPAFALDAGALGKRVLAPARVRALLQAYGSAVLVWPQLWEFCRRRHR